MERNRLITLDKQEFITELAESIVEYHFGNDGEIIPSEIANAYGITYSLGNYEDAFDGLLEHDNGKFHIYVNLDRQQSKARQRFTFSHELGHFFIDQHRNALVNGQTPYHSSFTGFASENIVEREADFFAACLLMPRNRVVRDYSQYRKFEFNIIHDFCKKYQISLLAAIFRLFHLDVHPMMIVHAINESIKWVFTSKDFYYYPKYKKKRIPEDSIMHEYFTSGKKYQHTQQIWTGDWFNKSNDHKLYEHCLYYDSLNSCYSIVWKD